MSISDYDKRNKFSLVTISVFIFILIFIIIGSLGGLKEINSNFNNLISPKNKNISTINLLYVSNKKVLFKKNNTNFKLLQISSNQTIDINSIFLNKKILNISYSPNGKYLCIVIKQKNSSNIFIVKNDNFKNIKIVKNLAGKDIKVCKNSEMTWSLNNKYLLFYGCDTKYSNIYISNIDSNKSKNLNYHILNNTDELISDKKRDLVVLEDKNFLFSKIEDSQYGLYKASLDFNSSSVPFNLDIESIISHVKSELDN